MLPSHIWYTHCFPRYLHFNLLTVFISSYSPFCFPSLQMQHFPSPPLLYLANHHITYTFQFKWKEAFLNIPWPSSSLPTLITVYRYTSIQVSLFSSDTYHSFNYLIIRVHLSAAFKCVKLKTETVFVPVTALTKLKQCFKLRQCFKLKQCFKPAKYINSSCFPIVISSKTSDDGEPFIVSLSFGAATRREVRSQSFIPNKGVVEIRDCKDT